MLDINHNSCLKCIHGWENFKNLSEEELSHVNENRYEATYKPGEIIFKQGTPCSNAIFIVHGLGKTYIEGVDGKHLILDFVKSSSMIMGPGMFVDNRNHFSLSALTPLKVCFVSSEILKIMARNNSVFADGFIRDVSQKSLNMHNKLVCHTHKKMHGRLADGLIYLADEVFEKDKFETIFTRKELGDFTNMTKESVVRILKEFNDEGIITLSHDAIEILDKDKLIRIGNSG